MQRSYSRAGTGIQVNVNGESVRMTWFQFFRYQHWRRGQQINPDLSDIDVWLPDLTHQERAILNEDFSGNIRV
jgi:hypothetical protein